MAAVVSRSGYLVHVDGTQPAYPSLLRADVDRLVEQLGPVAALDRLDAARAVATKLAAEARARQQELTARGFESAAHWSRLKSVYLVERYA